LPQPSESSYRGERGEKREMSREHKPIFEFVIRVAIGLVLGEEPLQVLVDGFHMFGENLTSGEREMKRGRRMRERDSLTSTTFSPSSE
jgi:hypothetical protein